MHYFRLAMAAGASIVVAAKLSPAYALPPVMPLDLNGPLHQGDMCIAPYGHSPYVDGIHYDGDTGPGYGRFYYCGPERHAHRTHHQREHRREIAPAAIQHAVYRPGANCLAHRSGFDQDIDERSSHFGQCPPDLVLARYHRHALEQHHHRHLVGHHHQAYAHHARVHHRKHLVHARHQRHAQVLLALSCDATSDVDLRDIAQFWQPAYSAQIIDTIVNVIDAEAIDRTEAVVTVTGDGGVGSMIGERIAPDGDGVLAQLFDAGPQPKISLGLNWSAEGADVNHAIVRTLDGERRIRLPASTGDRPAPIAPMLSAAQAPGERAPEPKLRPGGGVAADQIALTRDGYSSPIQSDAGMAVATKIGISPLAAVLGLALLFGAPLALVATQLTVADKAAAIETVSDPMAEWYIPAPNTVVVGPRVASAFPTAATRGRAALD